jgi:hypothetical protein
MYRMDLLAVGGDKVLIEIATFRTLAACVREGERLDEVYAEALCGKLPKSPGSPVWFYPGVANDTIAPGEGVELRVTNTETGAVGWLEGDSVMPTREPPPGGNVVRLPWSTEKAARYTWRVANPTF